MYPQGRHPVSERAPGLRGGGAPRAAPAGPWGPQTLRSSRPPQTPLPSGQPFKFSVLEICDRIKEEFQFLQAQYHRCGGAGPGGAGRPGGGAKFGGRPGWGVRGTGAL